eukprot:CFRG0784T1
MDDTIEKIKQHAGILKNNIMDFDAGVYFSKTPCARDAMLVGIGSGTVVGTARFLAAGKVMSSCNLGVAAWIVASCATWEYCRYNYIKEKEQAREMVKKMINRDQQRKENMKPYNPESK